MKAISNTKGRATSNGIQSLKAAEMKPSIENNKQKKYIPKSIYKIIKKPN